MKNDWKKVNRTEKDGVTIISYVNPDLNGITIESRRREIPHAGGRSGGWMHTTYFVVRDGRDVKEFWKLSNAKEYAEGAET